MCALNPDQQNIPNMKTTPILLRSTVRTVVLAVILLFVLVSLPGRVQAAAPDDPREGGSPSQIFATSSDGSILLGYTKNAENAARAFRWTLTDGMVDLGTLTGHDQAFARGASSDASVLVGVSKPAAGGADRAFRWTVAGGMENLGIPVANYFGANLAVGTYSKATAISGNGLMIVGVIDTDTDATGATALADRAFRYTHANTTWTNLGVLTDGDKSSAAAVSNDGSVVAGWSNLLVGAGQERRAFRWTGGTMTSLGTLGGHTSSEATGISSDGSVVVGVSGNGAGQRAFRWTGGTMTTLGTLDNADAATSSIGAAVSGDGSTVVGWSTVTVAGTLVDRGFRWNGGTMQSVEDWLTGTGATVQPGFTTKYALGISSDGKVVLGQLNTGESYIARHGDGLITLDKLSSSLAEAGGTPGVSLDAGSLATHGAHSRPLSRRVATGKSGVWSLGDIGQNNHGANDGTMSLAELGASHNFGRAQANLALGHTWGDQKLSDSGAMASQGDYAELTTMTQLAGPLWGVFSGFYSDGTAKIRRGYINAGLLDASNGRLPTATWGLLGRLQLDNGIKWGRLGLSPYSEFSYMKTHSKAFTETGGGFPAQFNARNDSATEIRIGSEAEYPVGGSTKLLGLVEGVHRFEKHGSRVSGQLLGLSSFDLVGATYKRDWMRFGVGVETGVAGGTLSVMANTTTRGEAPNFWLSVGWGIEF